MTICSAIQSWIKEVWQYLSSKCCFFNNDIHKQQNRRSKNNNGRAATDMRVFLSNHQKRRSRSLGSSLSVWTVNEKIAFWDVIQDHISHLLKSVSGSGDSVSAIISEDLINFDQLDSLNSDDFERCRQLTGKELWDGHYVTAVHIYRQMTMIFSETFLVELQGELNAELTHQKDIFEMKKIFLDTEK